MERCCATWPSTRKNGKASPEGAGIWEPRHTGYKPLPAVTQSNTRLLRIPLPNALSQAFMDFLEACMLHSQITFESFGCFCKPETRYKALMGAQLCTCRHEVLSCQQGAVLTRAGVWLTSRGQWRQYHARTPPIPKASLWLT